MAITLMWLGLSAIPVLFLCVAAARSGFEVTKVPFLWGACAGLTAPIYVRQLGAISERGPGVFHSVAPAVHHLAPACARFVREAHAIRIDIVCAGLDASLRRAWELMQDVEHAEPNVHAFLERAGATLRPIRELLEARTTRGRSKATTAKLRERLVTALARFERALGRPRSTGFR